MTENPRFAEYATSGAFAINLSRNLVSTLSLAADGGLPWPTASCSALERRGLLVAIAAPERHSPDRVEYRATHAGLLVASLVRQAGLANGPIDPVAGELADLQAELEVARGRFKEMEVLARSAMARQSEAEAELVNTRGRLKQVEAEFRAGRRFGPDDDGFFRPKVILRLRDPTPEMADAELAARVERLTLDDGA